MYYVMTLNNINYTSPKERTTDGHGRRMVQTAENQSLQKREGFSHRSSSPQSVSCTILCYMT